jgi:lysosomal acid lipase/cholesteryl ester hydrolase
MNIEVLALAFYFYFSIATGLKVNESDQITNLIGNAGYQGEVHEVLTEDGYILKLHRINAKIANDRKPVLLCHGILTNSVDFLISGPKIAIAYLLSDNGYDVWLGNKKNKFPSIFYLLNNYVK